MQDAGESFESSGSAVILRTMGEFAGDHGRSQVPFGAVIGGFHIILTEKTQQPAAIMLRSHTVEQALIVGIAQDAITKQPRQVVIQSYCLLAVILRFH